VNQIVFEEPLISESRKPQLRRLIYSESLLLLWRLWAGECRH
jgi:hypothetical protein